MAAGLRNLLTKMLRIKYRAVSKCPVACDRQKVVEQLQRHVTSTAQDPHCTHLCIMCHYLDFEGFGRGVCKQKKRVQGFSV